MISEGTLRLLRCLLSLIGRYLTYVCDTLIHKGARSRWQNSMAPADWGVPEGGEMDEQIGRERATAEIDKERWMNGSLYVIWPLIKWCSDIERCWNGVMVDRWGDTGGGGCECEPGWAPRSVSRRQQFVHLPVVVVWKTFLFPFSSFSAPFILFV